MLSFNEFVEKVVERLSDVIGKEVGKKTVVKNNGEEHIAVVVTDCITSPVLYIEGFYKEYKNGYTTLGEALESIIELFNNALETAKKMSIEIEKIKDGDYIKQNVMAKVVSSVDNSYLEDKEYTEIDGLGMAYIYYLLINDDDNRKSVVLCKGMIDKFNITKEELHEVAIANTEKNEKAVLTCMQDVLFGMLGADEVNLLENKNRDIKDEIMFILTNESITDGAVTMFYKDKLKEVADRLDDDLYVIPSSIHEVIIVPKEQKYDNRLTEILRYVNNGDTLKPDEVLSNDVFEYTRTDNVLKIS